MYRFALATALTLSLAAPAFANQQLANSLGVDANDYSVSQLIALRDAVEDNNWTRVDFIKQSAGDDTASVSSKSSTSTSGTAQLAASLGVEPGTLSLSQLINLRDAEENEDHFRANAIRQQAYESGMSVSSKGSSRSAGVAQLESALNVDPGVYSLAELIELRSAVEDGDWFRVDAIRSEANSF